MGFPMRRVWRLFVTVLAGLFLITGKGPGQERSLPAPPWGQSLEAAETAPAVSSEFFDEPDEWSTAAIWVRPEYILSWIHSSQLPPLVSTGLTTDKSPGAFGLPFTKILYGNSPVDYEDRHGLRITAGGLFAEDLAIEATYLTLGGREPRFQSGSPGNPIIARPFIDALRGVPDSSLTTYPGFLSGSIDIRNSSYLQSEELNAIHNVWTIGRFRLRALAGLRHVGIRESLDIQETATVTDATSVLSGQTVRVRDLFRTTNNFYGAQLGLMSEYHWRRFTLEMFAKAAIGDVEQRVSIDGATSFLGVDYGGGLLALSSNSGSAFCPKAASRSKARSAVA
jgi:hypothetical protein